MAAWEEFLGKPVRKYIETVFSGITNLFSKKKIHAVTPQGFELKIVWFSCWPLLFSACKGQLGLSIRSSNASEYRDRPFYGFEH